MGSTSIEWTDRSLNPIRAKRKDGSAVGHYCELVSPGCQHCYSSNFQKRFRMPPFVASHRDDVEPCFDPFVLNEVLGRKKPTKFFWCDMTDMFGSWVPDAWIDACVAAMILTPQHTHQVLTKRAERMRDYFTSDALYERVLKAADNIRSKRPALCSIGISNPKTFPPRNIWLGVSVENQKYADERIPRLIETPAAVRFLSCEPLLGPLDLTRWMPAGKANWQCQKCGSFQRDDTYCLHCKADAAYLSGSHVGNKRNPGSFTGWENRQPLDQIIAGGESGTKARPCHPSWVRSLLDQCKAAGVAFFWKQWGQWAPYGASGIANGWNRTRVKDGKVYGSLHAHDFSSGKYVEIPLFNGKSFETQFMDPNYECLVKVGKKAAGRMLDGDEYSEFPEVSHAR